MLFVFSFHYLDQKCLYLYRHELLLTSVTPCVTIKNQLVNHVLLYLYLCSWSLLSAHLMLIGTQANGDRLGVGIPSQVITRVFTNLLSSIK